MEYLSSNSTLIMGFAAGLIFGFLLRKGMVTRFETIVGQFLLKDFTVVKIMLTAILVGSIGVYAMHDLGIIEKLPIKNAFIFANIGGGILFGIGMSILGLCPGTCVGAIAEGSSDGFFGMLGMLLGAALFAEIYDWLYGIFYEPINLGPMTLSTLTGWSPWFFIGILGITTVIFFFFIEKYENSQKL